MKIQKLWQKRRRDAGRSALIRMWQIRAPRSYDLLHFVPLTLCFDGDMSYKEINISLFYFGGERCKMLKAKVKKLVILGFGCVFFMAAAVIYSLLYNEGRCVYPMDTYVFQTKDIPMLLAGVITAVYVIYLVVSVFSFVKFQKRDSSHTRTISPKLGFLGFFGFLGFLGIWTYTEKEMIAPFMFFIFFGFFGFFFEGKLSDMLKDELYLENRKNAELKALNCFPSSRQSKKYKVFFCQ